MRVLSIAAIGLISTAIGSTAWAMGSGGGGGTPQSTPSMSAPSFDPAEEYRKGIEALKAENYSEAKASFTKVLDVAPRDAATNLLAGMADAGLNDLKSAQRHYEKAVRADDKLVMAHQELGVTYAKLGQRDKAQAQLTALQKLDTDCAGTCKDAEAIKAAIAAVQAALGAPAAAMLQTNPPLLFASADAGDHAYLDAVSLLNEGKYEQAIVSLDRAKASFGAHPDILTYLGFANRKLGRYDVAVSYYRQALATAPRHKGATEY